MKNIKRKTVKLIFKKILRAKYTKLSKKWQNEKDEILRDITEKLK